MSVTRQKHALEHERKEEVTDEKGRRCEITRYDDVRTQTWQEQPMTFYRIIEYRSDGTR